MGGTASRRPGACDGGTVVWTPAPADTVTRAERRRLRARGLWSHLLCRAGRHWWARRENREVGGSRSVFHVCRRCGRERSRHMAAWEYFRP